MNEITDQQFAEQVIYDSVIAEMQNEAYDQQMREAARRRK